MRRLHCAPCQKSPSMKIANRREGKTISGLPSRFGLLVMYRSPLAHKALRKRSSGEVSVLLTFRIVAEMFRLILDASKLLMAKMITRFWADYSYSENI